MGANEEAETETYADALGISGKSYGKISAISFIFISLLSFFISGFVNLLIENIGNLYAYIVWITVIGITFLYTYRKVSKASAFTIYLFIMSSAIFIGFLGTVAILLLSGGVGIPSVLASIVGLVFAYFKLQSEGIL